jgi:hypothetical protein
VQVQRKIQDAFAWRNASNSNGDKFKDILLCHYCTSKSNTVFLFCNWMCLYISLRNANWWKTTVGYAGLQHNLPPTCNLCVINKNKKNKILSVWWLINDIMWVHIKELQCNGHCMRWCINETIMWLTGCIFYNCSFLLLEFMSVALFVLSFMSSQSAFYAHYVHFSKIGNKNKLLDDSGTYGTCNTLKHKF